jgi:hypothetical protein
MTTVAAIRGFFAIPPGTKQSACEKCGQPIWWIEHRCKPKRKGEIGKLSRIPISIKNDIRAAAPTDTTWGQGFNHFADCIYADSFRRTSRNGGADM